MKKRIFFVSAVLCFLLNALTVFAQPKPNELYIILDISGSMNTNSKFRNVKEYLEQDVIGNNMNPGDSITLIEFGDTAKEAFTIPIRSAEDTRTAIDRINALDADNNYTDIGVAMEKFYEVMESKDHGGKNQTILFITDGKHAPPRTSPYFGKDLGIDERFKEIGQKISREGWFMYVVGIGADTDAKKIADAVENSVFRSTDDSLSDVDLGEYTSRKAEAEKEREDGAAAALAGNTGGGNSSGGSSSTGNSSDNRGSSGSGGEQPGKGFAGFVRSISLALGIPEGTAAVIVCLVLALLIIAVIVLLVRIFRPMTVQLDYRFKDKIESAEAKIGPGGTIKINTANNHLAILSDQGEKIFEIHRGLFSKKIRIIDDTPFGDNLPYPKDTLSKLTQSTLKMADGSVIDIKFK